MDAVDTIFSLMTRLPGPKQENVNRLGHTLIHGHLLVVVEQGEIMAYGEFFRMKDIPAFPVRPWPKDDPNGQYVYCYSAVAEQGYILKLIQLVKKTFPNCTHIVWHRERRNHKLYLERI